MSRARHALLLAGPTVRLASWRALPAAGALAVAMMHFLSAPTIIELRLAAIVLCAAAAFVLDDPAAQTLAASPTPLLFRRLLIILSAALLLLPAAWTLFAHGPADPAWQPSHVRWAVLLAIAVATFLAASRDPANRHARPARLRLPGH